MREIYVSVNGQLDNIGDSILRRGLLDAVRPYASRLHVFIGEDDRDYVSGLGLADTDHIYTSKLRWQLSALVAAARGHASYVFNPGETKIEVGSKYVGILGKAILRAVRARGGAVIHAGIGVRKPTGDAPSATRDLLASCEVLAWRDHLSRDFVGVGEVAPDWGFGETSDGLSRQPVSRTLLTISMRGDRPAPNEQWFDCVRSLAQSLSLEPHVVTQVGRDADRSAFIAKTLECSETTWNPHHGEQEASVRAVYVQSAVTISDRVHALIVAFTEGSRPVGLVTLDPEKINRTFAAAGIAGVGLKAADTSPQELVARVGDLLREDQVSRDAELARNQVDILRRQIADALSR